MRSSVASRMTWGSPCLARKLEISSAGEAAMAWADMAGAASSRAAIAAPTARRVIPRKFIAHQGLREFRPLLDRQCGRFKAARPRRHYRRLGNGVGSGPLPD